MACHSGALNPCPEQGPLPLCGHDLTLPSRRSRSSISFAASSPAVIRRAATTAQKPWMGTEYFALAREIFGNIGGLHLCLFGTIRLGQVLAISTANVREKGYQARLAHGEQYLAC